MDPTITDEQIRQLLPRCQRAEAGAFEQLYDLYADRIYRYLLARTGDADCASDLSTEVFLRVLEHIPHFRLSSDRPAASFSAWLYRIAANLITDHHRQQGRRPVIPLDAELELASNGPDPHSQAVRKEEARRLADALDCLTEDQRQVVIGKFTEGMSNQQIARWLSKTEGAVEALQHRALRTLGRLLKHGDGQASGNFRLGQAAPRTARQGDVR
jgi:RNA polymerase sigma-70 factor (ECF subfamily)